MAYHAASFKACTRRTVAFSIIFCSLGFILVTIVLSVFNPNNDSAKNALNTIMPLSAGFIGSIMAFYFSDEGRETPGEELAPFTSHTLIFMRDSFTVDYPFNKNDLDGTETMKDVLGKVTTDPESGASLLDKQGGGTLFFSYSKNLRMQTVNEETFNSTTLKSISDNMRGTLVIKISLESS